MPFSSISAVPNIYVVQSPNCTRGGIIVTVVALVLLPFEHYYLLSGSSVRPQVVSYALSFVCSVHVQSHIYTFSYFVYNAASCARTPLCCLSSLANHPVCIGQTRRKSSVETRARKYLELPPSGANSRLSAVKERLLRNCLYPLIPACGIWIHRHGYPEVHP